MKKRSLIENYQSFNLSTKQSKIGKCSNSPKNKRGRQLFSFSKPYFKVSNINNSKATTCDSKNKIPLENNIKTKKNYMKERRNLTNNISENISEESDSFDSIEIRKKKNFKEESFNYPNKSDVGLVSSDEESLDMEPHLKYNLETEIESILIEMYNKNFPCNDKNYNKNKKYKFKRDKFKYLNKNNIEINKNELKVTFCQLNERYNYFVLEILSKKIKELIKKYKEKLFENEDLSKILNEFKKRKEEINNKPNKLYEEYFSYFENKNLKENNNKIFSRTTSTSSNKSDSFILNQLNQFDLNKKYFHSILNIIEDTNLGTAIIRELNNIKISLKNSSYEIKQIFQYPLNLLKINFSIELIQLEAFNSILIKDDLISTILFQIKDKYKNKLNPNIELINSLENDKKYDKEEMTRFDKLISQKLKIKFNNEEYYNDNSKECIIDNNSIESDIENNYLKKNILSTSFSSIDSHININNNNINQNNHINNNNNNKDIIEDEKNKLNELDIDDLVKLIDSDENTVHKKKKKKKNKNKKNKNIINNNIINSEEKKIIENKNYSQKEEEKIKDFEVIYNEFKSDINNNSLNYNNSQKIKPKLTTQFLIQLYTKK